MNLPQDVLVEFFLRFDTFYLRRVAALVCKDWRAAHSAMHLTTSRRARYGHFQFNLALVLDVYAVASQGLYGPMCMGYIIKYDDLFVPGKTGCLPVSITCASICYMSYMHADGILAHPLTWVSNTLWSRTPSYIHETLLVMKNNEFEFEITLETISNDHYLITTGGIARVCPDLDISQPISTLVANVIRFALTHCIQGAWRADKLIALANDYPYGMLEHLHARWEPCLHTRPGDVIGKLQWRE